MPSHHAPLGLDVQLLYHPIGLVSAIVHRIGEDAMHVDTGRVVLELLSEVEITFAHRSAEHTAFHRILAYVSQHVDGQTMLRFLRCSHEAHLALREMMAAHPAQ